MQRSTLIFVLLFGAFVLSSCSSDGKSTANPDAGADSGTDGSADDSTLDLGEVRELEVDEEGSVSFELETEFADERYVLLLASLSREPTQAYEYSVSLNEEVLGEPDRTGSLEACPPDPSASKLVGWNEAVHAAFAGMKDIHTPDADPPNVGDMIDLTIKGGAGYEQIQAEVMIVSSELVIAFDRTTDPTMSVDVTILNDVADNFADTVLPRERIYFGQESDVNSDGHVTMLFSPLVFTATGGVTAYVFPCDLLPVGTPGCPASNEQEIIYLSPPDMLSSYMGTSDAITETVAHEFQHAIYFYRKFILNGNETEDESAYITEGMSAMAQDVSGFQAGNRYVAGAAIDGVDSILMADILAYTWGYNEEKDGIYRGAAYLLLRYLFEQLGSDAISSSGVIDDLGGVTFLNQMSDLASYGYEGVEQAAGYSADVFIPDLYTAMLMDDREKDGVLINQDSTYAFDDMWDDPITGKPHGVTMNYELADGSWQVEGVAVQQGGVDGSIFSGGVEYILVEAVEDNGVVTIDATFDVGTMPAVRLARVY